MRKIKHKRKLWIRSRYISLILDHEIYLAHREFFYKDFKVLHFYVTGVFPSGRRYVAIHLGLLNNGAEVMLRLRLNCYIPAPTAIYTLRK